MANKVGKTVAVIHKSIINPKTGQAMITAATPLYQQITAEFLDKSIKTSSGDTWKIKKTTQYKDAEYVSVAVTTA